MRTRDAIVDDLLVLAAQSGQVTAFQRLASRWHPRLVRHARRLTGDAEAARDATQDAWVAIVRGLHRLRDPARFGPWALQITTRRCADWIAGRQRDRLGHEDLVRAAASAPPEASVEDVSAVREALGRLPSSDRALLALFYVEGLSVAEIAHACRIPPGTVKSRLFHARTRLRAALEVCDDEEDGC